MSNKHLYLIDATAFCYRAFYALSGLATSFGQPTNAVFGFIVMLNKVMKEHAPELLGICFDVSRETFRQKKFAEYKINRPPMPEGLSSQIPLIKEVVKAFGIALFERQGYEADDIIATLARKAKAKGIATTIISSDKDILQLVDERTSVFSPYKDEGVMYDEKKVHERFGVSPSRISDVIALMGDSVDNIPGIPGVGEKTAVGLIKTFGSVDSLLTQVERIPQERIRTAIRENADKIKLNKELTVLDEALDLTFDERALEVPEPDYQELFRIYKRLEFKAFLKDLPVKETGQDTVKPKLLSDEAIKGLLKEEGELILYGDTLKDLTFFAHATAFQADGIAAGLKTALSNPACRKTGYDLKRMKLVLAKEDIALEGLEFDAMIAAYLLNPSKPEYTLNDTAWDFLGTPLPSGQLEGARAVSVIAQLVQALKAALQEKSLASLFTEIEMPLVDVLAHMEMTGIKVDPGVLKRISGELEKRLIELNEAIYSLSGCQFNINSPKQLREVLFEKLKLPVVKRTKTGPSTDEEVLRSLAAKHKLPALLLEYRQLMKLKTTYVDALPNLIDPGTQRIHTSFNQTGTETGRLSSSNPNLQNIPIKTGIGRSIRRSVVSFEKGTFLLSCDYSQIELRILAHISRDAQLIDAFKKDEDIHKATAALIHGVKEGDVTEEMRTLAKRVNFGIVYGLTSFGLARDLSISFEEAQGFIDAYFARYPGVKQYIDTQIASARKDGFVTTILGRRRYVPEITNKNPMIRQLAERQAVNTPIQGSASDLIKSAMVQIHRAIKEKGLQSAMILQIHDELLFDVPDEEAAAFIPLVKDKMENVLRLEVPVKVDMKKGKNWAEMEEIR